MMSAESSNLAGMSSTAPPDVWFWVVGDLSLTASVLCITKLRPQDDFALRSSGIGKNHAVVGFGWKAQL
ncbi:hypothetical protein B296_00009164 [Ensete ventricosum]|uniref:Uncharacterized protein n=1 Tax=Ensete ventricosum TaxID=4639 RepID=A0A427A3I2_ENSVE|nr:hypothetical protein B296_00009164 [Ensete ventricosum]